jgi:uncharacterized protein
LTRALWQKLFTRESHHEQVETATRNASRVAVSVVAYPEARSAFARKLREGVLPRGDHERIVRSLDEAWIRFDRVRVTDEVARPAGEFAERLALRGLDAIHLASAVALHEQHEDDVYFLAFDERLTQAARLVMPVYDIE